MALTRRMMGVAVGSSRVQGRAYLKVELGIFGIRLRNLRGRDRQGCLWVQPEPLEGWSCPGLGWNKVWVEVALISSVLNTPDLKFLRDTQ